MKNFDELMEIAAILHGPDGCLWDRKQTFATLQQYVLEETHEVLEAVDSNEDFKIIEELGDLLYTIIFYAKIAQKEGRFTMQQIIDTVKEKLIRRHPHVFGDQKITTEEEIEKNWEKIKKEEKGKDVRTHAFDGIPPSMPLIARAQRVLSIMMKSSFPLFTDRMQQTLSEQEIAQEFLHLVWLSELNGFNAESIMRRALTHKQDLFLRQ
ncbi:MAG: MazG family protein [Chlamydiae bacterium]|nr:MazG family protein [Chlamydiota bacterium]